MGGNFARRMVMNSRLELLWIPAARPDTSVGGIISRGRVRGIFPPAPVCVAKLPEMSFPSSCACQHTSCAVGRFSSPPQKNPAPDDASLGQAAERLAHSRLNSCCRPSPDQTLRFFFLAFFLWEKKMKQTEIIFFETASAVGSCTSCLVKCRRA